MPLAIFKRYLTTVVIFIFCTAPLISQPGLNDPTFNPTDIGNGMGDGPGSGIVSHSVIQPDGKTIIVGGFTSYNHKSCGRIARLDTNGLLDTTFIHGIGANTFINRVALQPDGKIIIGGPFRSYNNTTVNGLARLNSDGSLDTTFSSGAGIPQSTGLGFELIESINLQSNGRIIVSGNFGMYNGVSAYKLIRLHPNGSLDPSFNIGTGVTGSTLYSSMVYSTYIQPDGKILVGGYFNTFNNTPCGSIIRLNTNGSIDPTFNAGTGAEMQDVNGPGKINSISFQSNGKILIGGYFQSFNGVAHHSICRLFPNGSLDSTYSLTLSSGLLYEVSSICIRPDNEAFVGGQFFGVTSLGDTIKNLVLLDTTGTVDTAFNHKDKYLSKIFTIQTQTNGKILAGGYHGVFSKSFSRFKPSGEIDSLFNPLYGANERIHHMATQPDNKLIISGEFSHFNGQKRISLARLHPNGTFDTSFKPALTPTHTGAIICPQPNGKIILAGTFAQKPATFSYPHKITRLNPNGSLDLTFMVDSFYTTKNPFLVETRDLKLQPDGKILVASNYNNNSPQSRIDRLNTDGSLDSTFSSFVSPQYVHQLSLQSNGKILIGGMMNPLPNTSQKYLARLNSDGSFDYSFNSSGQGLNGYVSNIGIQSDKKIIITGDFYSYNGQSCSKIIRLDTNGVLDTSFTPPQAYTSNYCNRMKVQDDDKIVMSFYSGTVIRLNSDGSLDSSFQIGSATLYNGLLGATIYDIGFQTDGRIVVAGSFISYAGIGRNRITRLLNCYPSTVTDSIHTCHSYTWIDGKTYTSSNYTATHSFFKANGCDSIIELKLTITRDSSAFNAHACDSFVSPSGNYTWSSTGIYTDTLQTIAGCDSLISVNLQVDKIDTSVFLSNATLFSNHSNASYQWLDCGNHLSPISGETNQTFQPSINGTYAVEITNNGCIDTSACYAVNDVSLNQLTVLEASVYPNPSRGRITISLPLPKKYNIKVYNMAGNLVKMENDLTGEFILNLDNQPAGLYNLTIISGSLSYSETISLR